LFKELIFQRIFQRIKRIFQLKTWTID